MGAFMVDSPVSRNRKCSLFWESPVLLPTTKYAKKESKNGDVHVTMLMICYCLCCSTQHWRPNCARWSVSTWSSFRKWKPPCVRPQSRVKPMRSSPDYWRTRCKQSPPTNKITTFSNQTLSGNLDSSERTPFPPVFVTKSNMSIHLNKTAQTRKPLKANLNKIPLIF